MQAYPGDVQRGEVPGGNGEGARNLRPVQPRVTGISVRREGGEWREGEGGREEEGGREGGEKKGRKRGTILMRGVGWR